MHAAWLRACQGLGMQCLSHILGRGWIEDMFGGLVDVARAITDHWERHGLAKRIAKPSK